MVDHDSLEEFADPAGYDRKDSSDTGVAFYAALALETRGTVLEIACGTGRVAIWSAACAPGGSNAGRAPGRSWRRPPLLS